MSKNFVESIVGLLVLITAFCFLYYAYSTTMIISDSSAGYRLFAKFDRIDGLNVGSDVKISGIKVGKIISQDLDPKTFQAILQLNIVKDLKLPTDTSAEIVSNGLLGDKYVALVPGSENEFFIDKSTIEFTQSSVSLESLIGKFMFNSATDSAKTEWKQQNNLPDKANLSVKEIK
jgi:phospholipid/cholesterol/gamma-HCH transport system substrate-binding protein